MLMDNGYSSYDRHAHNAVIIYYSGQIERYYFGHIRCVSQRFQKER